MAYPPAVPPATRVNATPQVDNHPADHNGISNALTDIVNELGANPSGSSSTVQDRVAAVEARATLLTACVDIVDVNTGAGGLRGIQSVTPPSYPGPVRVTVTAALIGGYGTAPTTFGISISTLSGGLSFGNHDRGIQAPTTLFVGVTVVGSWHVAAGAATGFNLNFNGISFGGATCHTFGQIIYQITAD
jgi:hypothetical protein